MSKIVSSTELMEKLTQKQPLILAEVLPRAHYEDSHLPGAIHLPLDAVKQVAEAQLRDKDAEIVVYCANTACQNSHQAATVLTRLGYANVSVFAGGKAAWREAGFPFA